MNGYECVQFERKDRIGIDQPTAMLRSSSAAMKGGSAVPRKNGKAINYVPNQTKPMKKVFHQKHVF